MSTGQKARGENKTLFNLIFSSALILTNADGKKIRNARKTSKPGLGKTFNPTTLPDSLKLSSLA